MAVENNSYNIQEVGLAKALVRKGHICDILFWTDKTEEIVSIPADESGVVHVFYRHGQSMLKNTIFTNCNDLFEQYDILQPCEYNQMQAWLLAKNQPHKTVIYHGPYYSPFNKRYNLMCKMFDALFLNRYIKSETRFLVKSEMAKEFLTGKGIKAGNVNVVGVGIDAEVLHTKKSNCTEPLYQALKRDKSSLKLLYIGRFEKRRNVPFIIDVFKKILEMNLDARLYMIGTGEPEYLKMVITHMENSGVRDKIIWQEKMEQKYLSGVYQQMDFFLLPTEYEIFGMVLLEAMYYGNVVLTTRNGGSSTLIEEGSNGYILKAKNPDEWARCITDICSNKNKMKEIQKNASLKVKNQFTWDLLADKFIGQYQLKLKGE